MNRVTGFPTEMSRWACLSDSLFGDAAEMDLLEAETLLRASGIDPEELKSSVYQKLQEKAQSLRTGGRQLPRFFSQTLDDLRPLGAPAGKETELFRQAKAVIKRVIERAQSLRELLESHTAPSFTTAYRQKKELSPRDKEVLDSVTEEQRKRIEKFKGN